MKKILNILLLVSFIITIMVSVTGIHIHKLASTVFLLLTVIHIIMYRKKLSWKRGLLLAAVLISFVSGLFGMILEQFPFVLTIHRVISIGVLCFLAIHIFVLHKYFLKKIL